MDERTIIAERDPRPSADLMEVIAKTEDENEREALLLVIHARGGEEEFKIGAALAGAEEGAKRLLGIEILGQLGCLDCTFREESVKILLQLLNNDDPRIIAAAATALGHRADPAASPKLVALKNHPERDVRFGVAFGLAALDTDDATDALIELSGDVDTEIRNWATFALGSLSSADTPSLRAALLARSSEEDDELRGEAILGLARVRHPEAAKLISKELRREEIGLLALEAAELLADPGLYGILCEIRDRFEGTEVELWFVEGLDAAMDACEPHSNAD